METSHKLPQRLKASFTTIISIRTDMENTHKLWPTTIINIFDQKYMHGKHAQPAIFSYQDQVEVK